MELITNNILMFNNNDGSWKFQENSYGNIKALIAHDNIVGRNKVIYNYYTDSAHGQSILKTCIRDYKIANGIN